MHPRIEEARLRSLERRVEELEDKLHRSQKNEDLQLFSANGRPPALSFSHGQESGTIEAGDFGNGYKAMRISSAGTARLDLVSGSDVFLQSGGTLHLHAPNVRIEAQRVGLDGELSARLCATEPFTWRSGQGPVRLVHHSHGIPVLTELKGKFRNNSSGIRMYVDPEDGFWYLAGDSSKGAELFARVVCIGRV